MNGWVKIYRKLLDNPIWKAREPFDTRSAWIDILLSASYEDKTVTFNGRLRTVARGQLLTSTRKLAERWGWSVNRVRRFLGTLTDTGAITVTDTHTDTLLTLIKYEDFQGEVNSDGYSGEYSDGYSDGYTIKRIKEEKNKEYIKEKYKREKFEPPSLDDVKQYITENGYNVDANRFVDFYASKGWMVGKNKMKDWKACIRTWARKDNSSYVKSENSFNKVGYRNDYDDFLKELE